MATHPAQAGTLLRHLRQLVSTQAAAEASDAELLQGFLAGREEAAFAALMQRHGQVVWSVCRHVLHQEQDIEDAFQATFLVLARKTGSIRKGTALGSFLHGVAYRVALTTRRSSLRRRTHEGRVEARSPEQPPSAAALREIQALLDDEVQRLPEKYRSPFVLCCLEGMSKSEAARELGWKEGTVSSRVAHARERLRKRLVQRGVTLSAALCATTLAGTATAVSSSLPATTLQAALEPARASAAVTARVAAVLGQASRALLIARLQLAFVLVLALGVLAAGAALLPRPKAGSPPESGPPPQTKAPVRTDLFGDPLPAGALARLGSVRLRLGGYAMSVSFSPDGKQVAAGGHDGVVYLWETASGKVAAQLGARGSVVTAVRFFPNGKKLASAGHDGIVRIWDLATRREQQSLVSNKMRVQSLAIAPDGKSLASGSLDQMVRIWDLATGKATREIAGPKNGPVEKMCFSADGKQLLWSGEVQGLHVIEVATGKELHHFPQALGQVQCFACSGDGKLAWAGFPGGIHVVALATGKEINLLSKKEANIWALAFSPDSKYLAVTGFDMKVKLWEMASGKEAHRLEGSIGVILEMAFSADGKQLAAACPDSSVCLWEVSSSKLLHEMGGHRGAVTAVAFTPDGKTVLTGSADRTMRLWDPHTGKEKGRLPGVHGDELIVAADGKNAYSAGFDRNVLMWQLPSDQPGAKGPTQVRRFVGGPQGRTPITGYEIALTLSANGKMLAATDNRNPPFFWETATGKDLQPLAVPKKPYRTIALAPDGRTVALRTQEGILSLWDLPSGKERHQLGDQKGFNGFAFSADGRSLLALDADLHLWEVATGRQRWHIKAPLGRVLPLALSPTNRLCAVGREDGVIEIHDAANGKEMACLSGHLGEIHGLAFAPDGRRMVSASRDTTALVWDVAPLDQALRPAAVVAKASQLDALWKKLLEADAPEAYQAIQTLMRSPAEAVPFLKTQLATIVTEAGPIARRIADLDNDKFEVRQDASKALEEIGPAAIPALEKVLEGNPSPELRERVELLLQKLRPNRLSMQKVRAVRTLEVLERIATPDARAVVKGLASKKEPAWLRQEAETMLERWAKKRE